MSNDMAPGHLALRRWGGLGALWSSTRLQARSVSRTMLGRDPPRRHPVWHDGQRACERKIAKSTLHRIVHCTGSGGTQNRGPDRTGHRIGLGRISTGPDRPDPALRRGPGRTPHRILVRGPNRHRTGPDGPDKTPVNSSTRGNFDPKIAANEKEQLDATAARP